MKLESYTISLINTGNNFSYSNSLRHQEAATIIQAAYRAYKVSQKQEINFYKNFLNRYAVMERLSYFDNGRNYLERYNNNYCVYHTWSTFCQKLNAVLTIQRFWRATRYTRFIADAVHSRQKKKLKFW